MKIVNLLAILTLVVSGAALAEESVNNSVPSVNASPSKEVAKTSGKKAKHKKSKKAAKASAQVQPEVKK